MSMRTSTTYLAECDYPYCHISYDYWDTSEENETSDITDDGEWLCLFTSDGKPRFFCPLHVRYEKTSGYDWTPVYYDSYRADKQPITHDLRKYYEDVSTPQPLPKPECESSILKVLAGDGKEY